MRRHAIDLTVLFVLATTAVVTVSLAEPGVRSLALHAYVLALGGLAMLAIVSAAGAHVAQRRRSAFEAALPAPRGSSRPIAELERLIREVTLATASEYDLHMRLVPRLREIAWAGVERSGRAPGPDTLGRWWPLLDPARDAPLDRRAHGISERDLRALVSDLARM